MPNQLLQVGHVATRVTVSRRFSRGNAMERGKDIRFAPSRGDAWATNVMTHLHRPRALAVEYVAGVHCQRHQHLRCARGESCARHPCTLASSSPIFSAQGRSTRSCSVQEHTRVRTSSSHGGGASPVDRMQLRGESPSRAIRLHQRCTRRVLLSHLAPRFQGAAVVNPTAQVCRWSFLDAVRA